MSTIYQHLSLKSTPIPSWLLKYGTSALGSSSSFSPPSSLAISASILMIFSSFLLLVYLVLQSQGASSSATKTLMQTQLFSFLTIISIILSLTPFSLRNLFRVPGQPSSPPSPTSCFPFHLQFEFIEASSSLVPSAFSLLASPCLNFFPTSNRKQYLSLK